MAQQDHVGTEEHLGFMNMALLEADKCIPTPTAFCVGCVLTCRWPDDGTRVHVLSTGYSRELPGNTHAEANALAKAKDVDVQALLSLPLDSAEKDIPSIATLLEGADVYTTLEPCSIRTSGLAPCADALIAAKVRRCCIGVAEPPDFVNCEGATKLVNAGIEVIWLKGLEDQCLLAARRGH